MPRPPNADSAETIARILAAALEEIDAHPDARSPSLRGVARRAGVGLGTIQYYYRSKRELLEACLDGYHERLYALAAELMLPERRDGPSRVFVEDTARAFYAFARREAPLLRLRVRTTLAHGELPAGRQRDFVGHLSALATEVLLPHVDVSALDARLAVHAMSALIVRFALMSESEMAWATGLDEDDAPGAIETYISTAARRLVRPGDG